MLIEFGEFQPDLADLGASSYALNCVPYAQGYRQVNAPSAYSKALAATCLGGFSTRTKSGAVWTFAGTTTNLYSMSGATASWTLATSAGGGTYTTDQETGWEFAKYGQNVFAVNGHTDAPQEISLSVSTKFGLIGGGHTVPPAKHIAVIGEFVVLGNLNDTAVLVPNRVRWSGLANPHTWNSSLVTQADYQDIANGGDVQKIVQGTEGTGYVIMESSIYRMVYEGLPYIFRFNEVLPGIGTPSPGSVATHAGVTFFLGVDGFLMLEPSGNIRNIGYNKVDKTFWNEVNESYLQRMRSVVSPVHKRVFWAYVGPGANGTLCNRILVYDWGIDRWSRIDVDVEILLQAATPGYTLDTLDSTGFTLDTLPFSLDSRAWAGSIPDVAIFDSTHKLSFYSGSAMQATIETKEVQLSPNARTFVKKVRPVVDIGQSVVMVGYRDNQSNSVSYGVALSPNSSGVVPMRSNARYHRFRVVTSGSWGEAVGIDVEEYTAAGPR